MFPPAEALRKARATQAALASVLKPGPPIFSGNQRCRCRSDARHDPPIGKAPRVLSPAFVEFTANRFPLLKRSVEQDQAAQDRPAPELL